MRALATTAFMTALVAAWACSADDGPASDGPGDAGPPKIDAGDGTCSVDTSFSEPVLVAGLAQAPVEIVSATLSDDERRIVFALVDGVDGTGDAGVDHVALYEAERASLDSAFENPRPLSSLNEAGESSAALTNDFLTIYFPSLREDKALPGHIFKATRATTADAFGAPVKVDSLDIEVHRQTPHVARHARELWFSAAGRSQAFRIYSAKLRDDGLTDAPVVAGELSLSGLAATHPVLGADGRSIYWRAYGVDASASTEGGNIWLGTRSAPTGPFEAMRPVEELRSPYADRPAYLSTDRCRLYFVSDRSSRRELYVATRSP